MKKILVTGASGQLGRCLKDASLNYPAFNFHFADRSELDVAKRDSVKEFFANQSFDYCINTAAYTNVEKAESEEDAAFSTNAIGAKNLAEACADSNTLLVHISTDYVFDGEKRTPYLESDPTNPINSYGASKLKGEEYIQEVCDKHLIIRTSWLYSQYGHNFLNSMLRFAEEGRDLSITTEQVGVPTNANDLAVALLEIASTENELYGLYHFSNKGSGTWYDFAEAIFTFSEQIKNVKLAKTEQYRTFAARPAYSILNTDKLSNNFGVRMIDWKDSLQQLIKNHKQ
ncbi:MAG: dTDP-4-dehydrorhamnose reductase [Bacteroidota bacterium]